MPDYTRRDVIRAGGLLAAAGVSAGCKQASPVEPASANIQFAQNSPIVISGSSPSGQVEDIEFTATGTFEWSNVSDEDAHAVDVVLSIEYDGERYGINQAHYLYDGLENPLEFEVEPAPWSPPESAPAFHATEDGQTNETPITVVVTGQVITFDGTHLTSASTSREVVVEVTNEPDPEGSSTLSGVTLEGSVQMQDG